MPDRFDKIHRYLLEITPERSPILREMEKHAEAIDFPIIGPLVGRYLYQTTLLLKARHILELGSGFGYSAFWFSLAIGGRGRIVLTDNDRQNKRLALGFFRRAGLKSEFDYRVGDAIKIAQRLRGPFDIIMNDIDSEQYPGTIDLAARLLRKGGLFITDNLISSGQVCDKKPDKRTRAIMTFNRKIYEDERFFTTLLPLRDGVGVAVRK